MDVVAEFVLPFVVGLAVYSFSLWIAARILGDEGRFLEFLVISAIASVVGLIPGFGGILSLVVFFVLLSKFMDIELLKAILICAMAFVIRFGVIQLLFLAFGDDGAV